MARTGKITLKEGTSKKNGKPWAGLVLEVGTWSKLYFLDSEFEMDYVKKYLKSDEPKSEQTTNDNDLNIFED